MKVWQTRTIAIGALSCLGMGCASTSPIPESEAVSVYPRVATASHKHDIQLASAREPADHPLAAESNSSESSRPRPAYAQLETLPIDLPTVIRLIDGKSPTIAFAQAKVREAQARLASAEVQWLPNLSVGAAYTRFDGQTQNQRGDVFSVSRANLFAGGGPALTLDVAEAIYRPLIERRQTSADQLREQATYLSAELEGVTSYLDLVQAYGLLEINADILQKAELMLKAARDARDAKLDRTAGDVNRANAEVLLRRTERMDLLGRAASASARLSRLLLLPPNVKLVPADTVVAPVTLIDPTTSLDQLVTLALQQRPDLAANREAIAAAWERVRRQKHGPFIPKVTIVNQTGSLGGGLNDDLQNFDARNALSVQVYWEVRNLGLGNRADIAERKALLDQAQIQMVELQARATAEIVEAAQFAVAKHEALELAEQAVKEALELYRISKEGTFNVVDAKNLFDALRPLQAIQALNQARQSYLTAVLDYNRAQFRLFTFIGNRAASSQTPDASVPAK